MGVGFGGISTYFLFYPTVSIKSGASTNYYDPFETRFLISNDGSFSFYNMHYLLKIRKCITVSENELTSLGFGGLEKTVKELPSYKTQNIYFKKQLIFAIVTLKRSKLLFT